jgi:hypothetical protein
MMSIHVYIGTRIYRNGIAHIVTDVDIPGWRIQTVTLGRSKPVWYPTPSDYSGRLILHAEKKP